MGEAEQEMRAYEHALLMRHLRERWGMRDEDLRSRAMREEEEAALNAAGAKSYRVGRYEEARKGTRGSGALQRRQQLQARVKEQQRVEREHQQAVAEDELAHRRRDVERREEQMAMLERERQKFMGAWRTGEEGFNLPHSGTDRCCPWPVQRPQCRTLTTTRSTRTATATPARAAWTRATSVGRTRTFHPLPSQRTGSRASSWMGRSSTRSLNGGASGSCADARSAASFAR